MKVLSRSDSGRTSIVRGLLVLGTATALSVGLSACGGTGGGGAQEEGGAAPEAAGETARQQEEAQEAETGGRQAAAEVDWDAVGRAIGKEGETKDGGVYRVGFPRKDLEVTSRGVRIEPSLSLGSYAAFVPMQNGEAMVMGDLVLAEDELNAVVSSLQENGLEQTAVHKHLLDEEPAIWWQHFEGTGDPVELAGAVNEALSLTSTPMEASKSEPKDLGLDTARLDEIVGHKGENTGATYNFSIPRAEPVAMDGTEVPPSAGVATVLNFQPTGGGKAAVNGDFVMTEEEVDPVLRTLRENGIEVVALHNHTLDEEPRLFYTHFWANDDAEKLAEGLKAALDETNGA